MWVPRSLASGFLGLACLSGCAKPAPRPDLEKRQVVTSAEAPLLSEAEDDEPAAEVARVGQVVEVVRELGTLRWEAPMGDVTGKRDGRMVEVRQAPGEGLFFGFQSDLGPAVDVPTSAWLCQAISRDPALPAGAASPGCPARLRRIRIREGVFVAYLACTQGPCPVALVRDGRVGVTTVDGMVSVRSVSLDGELALLAMTRWVRAGGAWTGGSLVPLTLAGASPVALPAIPLDEEDARDPARVVARVVNATVQDKSGLSVHLIGERRETALPDGRPLGLAPIDQTIPLSAR